MSTKNGHLFVIEGIDGSGKSTLAQTLYKKLSEQNKTVTLTKEPGGSQLGQQLRTILQTQTTPLCSKAEYLLFAADRAQHVHEVIMPQLKQGHIIISDRMGDSSIVYQGYGRGLNIEMIKNVNEWAMNGIEPTLVFYVRISVEESQKRITQRGKQLTAFEKEHEDFLHTLVDGFDELFKHKDNGIVLDGTQNPDQLAQQAFDHIMNHTK